MNYFISDLAESLSIFPTGWLPGPSKHLRTHTALTSTTVNYMLKRKHVVKCFGKQGWAWTEENAALEHSHRWEGMTVTESWQDTGNDSFRSALRIYISILLKINFNHIHSGLEQKPCSTASPELVTQLPDGERAALEGWTVHQRCCPDVLFSQDMVFSSKAYSFPKIYTKH